MNISPSGINRRKVGYSELADPNEGSSLIAYNEYQTVSDHLVNTVQFEQFGAGLSNDDAALTRLITYLNSQTEGCRVLMEGRYTFNQVCPVVLTKSDVTFDGGGTGYFDCTALPMVDNTFLIRAEGEGATGLTTQLTADYIPNVGYSDGAGGPAVLQVVSTAGFQKGDEIAITTVQYYTGVTGQSGFRPQGIGFSRRIRAILSSTQIELDCGLDEYLDSATNPVHVIQLSMLKNLTLVGFETCGPQAGLFEPTDVQGPSFLQGMYVSGFREYGIRASNWPSMNTQLIAGTDYIQRDNVYRDCWAGVRVFSVRTVRMINVCSYGGRRPMDWDSRFNQFVDLGYAYNESVLTEDVQIIGGSIENSVAGAGGHICHKLTVIGLRTRNVNVCIHQRGKHLTVVGCDLIGVQGINLGVGASATEDWSTYDEDPSCGDVYIDETTHIRTDGIAVKATSSWTSIFCAAHMVARSGVIGYARHQSNVEIIPRFKSVGLTTTAAAVAISFGPTKALDANNIRIHSGRIEGIPRGLWHQGCVSGEISEVQVSNVHFHDVDTYYVRGESSAFDSTCYVRNCSHSGIVASSPVGSFASARGPVFWQEGNTWNVPFSVYPIVTGTIELFSSADTLVTHVSLTANENLTNLVGKKQGQIVVLVNVGTGFTLSLTNGTAFFLASTSLTLSVRDSVTLVCTNSIGTQWREISRSIFA